MSTMERYHGYMREGVLSTSEGCTSGKYHEYIGDVQYTGEIL